VSSGVSEEVAFTTARQAWVWNLAAIGLGLLGALLLSQVLGRTLIRRPIRELIDLAKSWSTGTPPPGTSLHGPPEVQEVADALNRMGTDLYEQTRTALENETRLRLTVQAAPYPLLLQSEDGEIIDMNESWWRQSGFSEGGVRPPASEFLSKTAGDASDSPFNLPFDQRVEGREWSFVGADDRERNWEFGVVPLGALPNGRRLRLIAAADITERKAAARRQDLLVAELNHRVKNTLAIVQSIGTHTASHSTDAKEFNRKFAERLQALARTHDLLTSAAWDDVALRGVIENELETIPERERISMDGPNVTLPAQLAVSIGLVIHELTTNAIKHGCFGRGAGQLSLEWTLRDDTGSRHLHLTWEERCDSPIAVAGKPGFGSHLINRTLAAMGSGKSELRPNGLLFQMTLRLPEAASSAVAA
jgi:PAS domain S-box-containing protein